MTTAPETGKRMRDGATLARVRSVSRAVAILRCFSPGRTHMMLGDITNLTQLDAGTTRRLLVTLRDEGLIGQAPDGRYHLTLQVMRLAAAVPEGRSLRELAQDHLRALAETTGLTVLLSVLQDGKPVCIAREHGDSPVQVRWWPVGESMPLNCGAAPRLLLAHMPEADQEAVLAGPLPALTRHSITNPIALRDKLTTVRERGWSLSTDDVVEGLAALASPVRDPSGDIIGAVSVGGLITTISGADGQPHPELLTAVIDTCSQISDRLH